MYCKNIQIKLKSACYSERRVHNGVRTRRRSEYPAERGGHRRTNCQALPRRYALPTKTRLETFISLSLFVMY